MSAMVLALPEDMVEVAQAGIAEAPLPDKSSSSRARLICDAGYMLWRRQWWGSRIQGQRPLTQAGQDLAGQSPEGFGLTLDA
eukprot:3514971-Lingulodinium_polyedra.AAC.1